MRVKLLTHLSFAAGAEPAGAELDLPDAQAEALVAHGLAERVTAKKAPEATTLKSDHETATLPRSVKRGDA